MHRLINVTPTHDIGVTNLYLVGDPWEGCEELKSEGLAEWLTDFQRVRAQHLAVYQKAILIDQMAGYHTTNVMEDDDSKMTSVERRISTASTRSNMDSRTSQRSFTSSSSCHLSATEEFLDDEDSDENGKQFGASGIFEHSDEPQRMGLRSSAGQYVKIASTFDPYAAMGLQSRASPSSAHLRTSHKIPQSPLSARRPVFSHQSSSDCSVDPTKSTSAHVCKPDNIHKSRTVQRKSSDCSSVIRGPTKSIDPWSFFRLPS